MARTKKEWVGKTDDAMPPNTVRLRIYRKQDGKCAVCPRKLRPGNITLDHRKPLEDGGENRESNCQLICTDPCSLEKTGEENSRRADADRFAIKQLGLDKVDPPRRDTKQKVKRVMPGSRKSRFKRKLDGTVVER